LEHRSKVVGVKQSLKAIRQGIAVKVYLADDADPFIVGPVVDTCKEYGVTIEYVTSKSALGRKCHIDVGAAVAAEIKFSE